MKNKTKLILACLSILAFAPSDATAGKVLVFSDSTTKNLVGHFILRQATDVVFDAVNLYLSDDPRVVELNNSVHTNKLSANWREEKELEPTMYIVLEREFTFKDGRKKMKTKKIPFVEGSSWHTSTLEYMLDNGWVEKERIPIEPPKSENE